MKKMMEWMSNAALVEVAAAAAALAEAREADPVVLQVKSWCLVTTVEEKEQVSEAT